MMRVRQISSNVFGKTGGRNSGAVRHSTGTFSMGKVVTEPIRKITRAGVGKDGIAKPKTGAISGRALTSRPVVEGMDTQGRVLKKAKKYWMWIVAAIIGYFLLKRR